jgi:exopolyphosphatase/guanosine-5'-triphosphate,3'-diphosphate pyrophosphatase
MRPSPLTASPAAADDRRYASFDVGSNTVRALTATLQADGALLVTAQAGRMTALGRGMSATGKLEKKAIAATAKLVAAFLREAGPVDGVFCAATAAAREAVNTEDLRTALRRAGVELEVISGEEEARLSYLGAVALAEVPPDAAPLVADLGGRSMELALRQRGRLRVVSLPLGGRALTEAYLPSEMPSRAEVAAARRAARVALAEGAALLGQAGLVVATGGTAFAAALAAGRWTLSATALQRLRRRLCRLTLAERRKALPFDPDRAEVICGGLLALEVLAERAPGRRLAISPGGLREGLLLERTGARRVVFPEGVGMAS